MVEHHNVVVGVAVVLSLAYVLLQVVALRELTSPRMEVALKYAGLILIAGFCLIDWFLGLTGWVLLEALILIVGLPIAIVHLTILLVQESREGQRFTES